MSTRALVHPTAVVDAEAELAGGVEVGPYAIIGRGVRIGEGSRVMAHAVVSGSTVLGARCIVHPFAVLGGDPQIRKAAAAADQPPGSLVIGDGNVFREHVTVSLSSGPTPTRIGDENLFMAAVHIGHDVVVGSHCVIANAVQLAGHVVVEDWVTFGGLAGAAQFVRVGQSAFVAAGAMCERSVPPFVIVQGDRARVRALNVVGLARRGVARDAVARLEKAYASVFARRSGSFDEAVAALDRSDPLVDAFARALTTTAP
ncbi:MAG: Acyl-[acyl-carrier-protein]--UDP-N-acetylglucosamine O-acyltransferase [Labilithrix sp.]|nr:Acyl-[acyl-carrier-protein]--UDP-N-acetylglucosamine O-acyltransferase [Labilithrix sp.]